MPDFLENRLRTAATNKGFTGEKAAHYVYGAMNNLGAMRGNKETAKGRAMEKKHEEKVDAKKKKPRGSAGSSLRLSSLLR